jgi:hypothetical protein
MNEEKVKVGNFLKISICPECGAPIWIDCVAKSINTLPTTYFSCHCYEAKQQRLKAQMKAETKPTSEEPPKEPSNKSQEQTKKILLG